MTNREAFIQAWGMESATTQRVLDAVPNKNLDYKPDPKSRSGFELAGFVAVHAPLLLMLLESGEIKGGPSAPPKTLKEATGPFAATLPALEKKLKGMDDRSWDQKNGKIFGPDGSVFQEGPVGLLAWFTVYDLIHHRGQLSAYLRAMGGKVPSIYGPSADDSGR